MTDEVHVHTHIGAALCRSAECASLTSPSPAEVREHVSEGTYHCMCTVCMVVGLTSGCLFACVQVYTGVCICVLQCAVSFSTCGYSQVVPLVQGPPGALRPQGDPGVRRDRSGLAPLAGPGGPLDPAPPFPPESLSAATQACGQWAYTLQHASITYRAMIG